MSSKRLPSVWPNVYCEMIPRIREIARQHGYAIGVHGSLVNDCDLMAMPWTDEASTPEALAEAVRTVLNAWEAHNCPGHKPHGRLVWSFSLDPTHYIDLSVMPITPAGRERVGNSERSGT